MGRQTDYDYIYLPCLLLLAAEPPVSFEQGMGCYCYSVIDAKMGKS